jgi:hypothetical protein
MNATSSNPKQPKRSWWRFRFSLKWLLLIVTAVCVWLGIISYRANRQRDAVAYIVNHDGGVSYAHAWDYSGRFPQEIKGATPPGPAWLRNLIGDHYFFDVTFMRLNEPQVTDEAGNAIAKLPKLKGLSLQGTGVSDETLKRMRGRHALRWLYLKRTKITDQGLAHVRELPNIESLALGETAITDAGLHHLSTLAALQELDLSDTSITDAGLSAIGKITSLKQLYLYGTNVSNAGLIQLEGLINLEELGLGRTRVTKAGVERLRNALPKADGISYDE